MIKRNIRFIMLTAMMMAASSAYAGYLGFSVNNNQVWGWTTFYEMSGTTTQTYTLTGLDATGTTNYYMGFSTSAHYYDMTTVQDFTFTGNGYNEGNAALNNCGGEGNYKDKNFKFIWFKPNTSSVTVSYNTSTKVYTINQATTTYTVTTSISGGTISPPSATIAQGSNAEFTVTPQAGYDYSTYTCPNATVVRNGNVFNVTPTDNTSLSITYTLRSLTVNTAVSGSGGSIADGGGVNYGSSKTIKATASDGYTLDRSNVSFSGTAEISYSVVSPTETNITLSNVTESGTLTVAFASDQTPVVDFGAMPTQNVNAVAVGAYLVERYCNAVTEIGFEWNTSNDFSSPNDFSYSDNPTAFTLSNSRANLAALKNGDEFSAIIPASEFSSITSGTNMFFRAYVKTSGDTGYSDVVGIFYNPCRGLTSVELIPTTVALPAGYEVTLQVVARGAGKSPTYTWYLDQSDANIGNGTATAISGITSDSYTYTMPSPVGSHHINVKVTEAECGTSQFTHENAVSVGITASKRADITACAEPQFTFEGESEGVIPEITTTPWAATTIIVVPVADTYTDYEWDVEPANAVLTGKNKTSVVLRADVLGGESTTYTVTYTAKGACTGADVKVSKQQKVTVSKDHDKCN